MKSVPLIRTIALFFIVAPFLIACATSQDGSIVTFELKKAHIEERLCLGMYEVEYPFSNGTGYASEEYYQLADGRRFDTFEGGILNAYKAFSEAESERHLKYLNLTHKKFKSMINNHDNSSPNATQILLDYFSSDSSLKFDSKKYFELLPKKLGMKPFVHSSKELIRKNYHAPLDSRILKNISNHFVPQSDPNICWAAALETAFRYIGKQYKQEEFVSALKNQCAAKLSKTASVNQMFFAATKMHLSNGGRWIGKFPKRNYVAVDFKELLKAFSPFYFDDNKRLPGHNWTGTTPSGSYYSFYVTVPGVQVGQYEEADFPTEAIEWETTRKSDGRKISEGKIKLIKSVAELMLAINDNYPVIAGFKQSQGGHAVVISGIEFRPGGTLGADNVYRVDHRAYLNYVYYLDPTSGPEPIGMSGDYFLENTVFMFYIDP